MFARQAFKFAQPARQVRPPSNPLMFNPAKHQQSFRQYATEAPKRRSLTPLYAGIVLTGAGVGLYRYNSGIATAESPKQRESVFVGGDQGWVDLKLASVEEVSHNTKRLRFEFPDKEKVSGLAVACMLLNCPD